MTTYYAAAKYSLDSTPNEQWHELTDLVMVAVELVRIARETGRTLGDVTEAFERATDAAADEWDVYEQEAASV